MYPETRRAPGLISHGSQCLRSFPRLCVQARALDALAAWLAEDRRLEARLATRETAQRLTALLAPLVSQGAPPAVPAPAPAAAPPACTGSRCARGV